MSQQHPSLLTVCGLPPGLLGESYVIVSAWQRSSAVWAAEFHLLTQRPSETRTSDTVELDISDYPPELPAIDKAYMEGEACQQAELALLELVEQRAKAEGRPEAMWHPFRLEPVRYSAVTLWTRGIHLQAIMDIAANTQSAMLKQHLRLVMSLQRLRRA